MLYAEVSVNSPIGRNRSFSYGVPAGLSLNIGQAVWVPFGDKTLQGIILCLTPYPSVAETREISGIIDPRPFLTPVQVSLASWISDYYLAPLFDCIALMLPPGFERRVVTYVTLTSNNPDTLSDLDDDQQRILETVRLKPRIALKELEKIFGARRVRKALLNLVHEHFLVRNYELEKVRIKPKVVSYVHVKVKPEDVPDIVERLGKRAGRQIQLLQYLFENPQPSGLSELKHKAGCNTQTIKALEKKGFVKVREIRVERDPLSSRYVNLSFPLPLNPAQNEVFLVICDSLSKVKTLPAKPDIFLLHGVTGSGKTEIYLQALCEAVRIHKRGIVLVPEIAMTPQIIERFMSRFPGKVAVLHSELSLGEQFDEWNRIKEGEFDVVIGPRSAIFAPQPDLGLIIIDEEHEWTYKQEENIPRYHTREVALKLAELTGATVILGSATPDIESYYRALTGEYRLLELPERVTPNQGTPLPQVEIVDLRAELKAGNLNVFSRSLHNSIETALNNHEQVLLFLNRRGAASFVECRDCGWVIRCKRCGLPLSYHLSGEALVCHHCNYRARVPQTCPNCNSSRIKYLGIGTERLEQETVRIFPGARILRWDSDVTHGHGHAHQEIFNKFKAGEADILIGTQMIAKGLDLPGVTLVGVISADIALNLPDFRAGERIFQLLSQVAGRAGRGPAGGKVIVQTYSPDHYAIQSAARHDYLAFYAQEIAYRRELHNPPFSRLARLTFTHINELRCQQETEKMRRQLLEKRDAQGLGDISLIGPAPAYVYRLRGRFRWQLVLRAPDPPSFLNGIFLPKGWAVDIDPVGVA